MIRTGKGKQKAENVGLFGRRPRPHLIEHDLLANDIETTCRNLPIDVHRLTNLLTHYSMILTRRIIGEFEQPPDFETIFEEFSFVWEFISGGLEQTIPHSSREMSHILLYEQCFGQLFNLCITLQMCFFRILDFAARDPNYRNDQSFLIKLFEKMKVSLLLPKEIADKAGNFCKMFGQANPENLYPRELSLRTHALEHYQGLQTIFKQLSSSSGPPSLCRQFTEIYAAIIEHNIVAAHADHFHVQRRLTMRINRTKIKEAEKLARRAQTIHQRHRQYNSTLWETLSQRLMTSRELQTTQNTIGIPLRFSGKQPRHLDTTELLKDCKRYVAGIVRDNIPIAQLNSFVDHFTDILAMLLEIDRENPEVLQVADRMLEKLTALKEHRSEPDIDASINAIIVVKNYALPPPETNSPSDTPTDTEENKEAAARKPKKKRKKKKKPSLQNKAEAALNKTNSELPILTDDSLDLAGRIKTASTLKFRLEALNTQNHDDLETRKQAYQKQADMFFSELNQLTERLLETALHLLATRQFKELTKFLGEVNELFQHTAPEHLAPFYDQMQQYRQEMEKTVATIQETLSEISDFLSSTVHWSSSESMFTLLENSHKLTAAAEKEKSGDHQNTFQALHQKLNEQTRLIEEKIIAHYQHLIATEFQPVIQKISAASGIKKCQSGFNRLQALQLQLKPYLLTTDAYRKKMDSPNPWELVYTQLYESDKQILVLQNQLEERRKNLEEQRQKSFESKVDSAIQSAQALGEDSGTLEQLAKRLLVWETARKTLEENTHWLSNPYRQRALKQIQLGFELVNHDITQQKSQLLEFIDAKRKLMRQQPPIQQRKTRQQIVQYLETLNIPASLTDIRETINRELEEERKAIKRELKKAREYVRLCLTEIFNKEPFSHLKQIMKKHDLHLAGGFIVDAVLQIRHYIHENLAEHHPSLAKKIQAAVQQLDFDFSDIDFISSKYDLATLAKATEFQSLSHCKRILHGKLDGIPVDITAYSGKPLDAILSERDMTIASMAWHPSKGLADPLEGSLHLQHNSIIMTNPQKQIRGDYNRLMRLGKYVAKFTTTNHDWETIYNNMNYELRKLLQSQSTAGEPCKPCKFYLAVTHYLLSSEISTKKRHAAYDIAIHLNLFGMMISLDSRIATMYQTHPIARNVLYALSHPTPASQSHIHTTLSSIDTRFYRSSSMFNETLTAAEEVDILFWRSILVGISDFTFETANLYYEALRGLLQFTQRRLDNTPRSPQFFKTLADALYRSAPASPVSTHFDPQPATPPMPIVLV